MSISFDFTGRTALVTGAAQGIGFEIATLFHAAGARVVAVDRDPEALVAAWPATERVRTSVTDVADQDAVAAAVDGAVAWAGGLDIVVNNAGVTRDAMVWKLTHEQWRTVLDVHLTGTFAVTRAAVPVMRRAGLGRIINVTSYTGLHGNLGQANYAAAKAGIIGFTKAVAKEVAHFGITVNAVSPNAATAMVRAIPQEKLAELTSMVPMGRFAEPSEMASAFGFLASAEAAYITGVVLPVDGGLAI
ncbi:3-oxoacyl-ACP reductase FabG [Pseudonocardia alni]|uniref:3-oxoacyl-ACP reductase FabG n=1 Tax=Pseudonocardia alni TaxID=33907 RepID=UPI0033187F97